jgi:hypothetical protein
MKYIIFYLALICLISCEKTEPTNKVFDINDFELLDIGNLTNFWGDTVDIDTFYLKRSSISNDSSFIGGIRFSCENVGQYIELYVFKSKADALNDMNARINTVACIIKEGTSDVITGNWWYSECIPNSVFASKWNTIIQVSYGAGNYDSVKDLLYKTVNEIIKRIDKLDS